MLRSVADHELCQRVKQWFSYQSQNHITCAETNWAHLLQRLYESSNPKPRKHLAIQQFMLENTVLMDSAFVSVHGKGQGMDGTKRMNTQHSLAKKILYGEHKGQISALEKHAQEHHEQEINQWSLLLKDIELASDPDA